MSKIGIVEDDPRYAQEFVARLRPLPGVESATIWPSGELFLDEASAAGFACDLVFMDVRLPGIDGIETIRRFHEMAGDCSIVVLSNLSGDAVIFEALKAGALGYILKDELGSLGETISTILDGGAIITPTIAVRIVQSFQTPQTPAGGADSQRRAGSNEDCSSLTAREREALELMVCGMTVAEAAETLKISPHTMKTHVRNIYRKLWVCNKAELVLRALELGLLDEEGR